MTPSRIATAIEQALDCPELRAHVEVQRLLAQALDGVADGMPADYVGAHLYSALDRLESV